jgi:hypothetical protein
MTAPHSSERKPPMNELVVVAALLALAYVAFRHGKRLGSRSGYFVGRTRGRTRRR